MSLLTLLYLFTFFFWCLCDRYNHTVFPLVLDHVKAPSLDLTEAKRTYPWLARLVPSLLSDRPTLCTLACVQPRVYITAARCILGLTVGVCAVIHNEHHFIVKALVISDDKKRTKEYFDDIGFVVISPNSSFTGTWSTIPVYSGSTRTDGGFRWLKNYMNNKERRLDRYNILAFHDMHGIHKPTKLYHLNAKISVDLCAKIYTRVAELQDYSVPCAITECNVHQYNQDLSSECARTIEKEGSIVYNEDEGYVFGAVSWGVRSLPMGCAVPNSEAYFENLECAVLLSEVQVKVITAERTLRLCDTTTKWKNNN